MISSLARKHARKRNSLLFNARRSTQANKESKANGNDSAYKVEAIERAARFTAKYRSDLKLMVDAQIANVGKRWPDRGDDFAERVTKEIVEPLDHFFDKVESIRTSGRFSQAGELEEMRLAARAVQEKWEALNESTVGRPNALIKKERDAALEPKTRTEEPILMLLRELRMQEVRRMLPKDPLDLKVRLRQVEDNAAGRELLDAIEGGPLNFPIVPADMVQEARTRIAEARHPEFGVYATAGHLDTDHRVGETNAARSVRPRSAARGHAPDAHCRRW